MRRVFTRLFYALVVSVFALSCKEEPLPEPVPPTPDALFTLEQTLLNVAFEGGSCSVAYSVENALEGVLPEAVTEAEWLHVEEPTTTHLCFTVEANEVEEQRVAVVNISYGEQADVATLTISQAPYEEPAPFKIVIEDLQATSCTARITPQDDNMWYVLYMANVDYFIDYGILTSEALYNDDRDTYMRNAEFDGMNLGDYMERYNAIFRGEKRVAWDNLLPGNEMVLYVYGIEFNGDRTDYTMTTEVCYELVVAPTAELVDVDFDLEVAVEGPDAQISVKPENWDGYYVVEIFANNHELYIDEGATIDEEYVGRLASYWMDNCSIYQMYYGYTIADILDEFCYQGSVATEQELMSEVQYSLVVYAVDEVGGVLQLVSRPAVKSFATQRVERVDMSFDIAVDNIGSRVADIRVTPSLDDEPYLFLLMPSEYVEGVAEEDMIEELLVNYYSWAYRFEGEITSHLSTLYDRTTYSIFVFGMHGGVVTTELYRTEFTTEAAVLGEVAIVDVEISGPYCMADLATLLPEEYRGYEIYTDSYVVGIEPKTDKPTADLFYLTWDQDTYNYYKTYYPDIVLSDTMTYYCEPFGLSDLCSSNVNYLVTAVAMDVKGNICDLWVTPTFNYDIATDARPIEELEAKLKSAPSMAFAPLGARSRSEQSLVYHK